MVPVATKSYPPKSSVTPTSFDMDLLKYKHELFALLIVNLFVVDASTMLGTILFIVVPVPPVHT